MSFTLKFSKYGFSLICRNSQSVILFFSGHFFSLAPFSVPKLHSPLCTLPSSEAEKRQRGFIFLYSPPLAPLIQNT